MKVAIYARYSSDNQRDASIADQFRLCRLHAEKQGRSVIEEYSDHAISGASMIRPGIQALMADAMRGRFYLILRKPWTAFRAIRRTSPGSSSACPMPT
jgi:DNA invertase Pin-like site-specific DNA recombinase